MVANLLGIRGYAQAAPIYRERGWTGAIPLPDGRKSPPPGGYTGRGGAWPSEGDVRRWSADNPLGNIGLRMPEGVIGIDVDSYGNKPGGASLYELITEYGPLPSTHSSTSRRRLGDDLSSIRFYRVPEGTRLRANPRPGIDIIQHHHRYAVVWPSWHTEVDAHYEWWGPDGLEADPPAVWDLPELPEPWLEALQARTEEESGGESQAGPGDLGGAEGFTQLVERYIERVRRGSGCHDTAVELGNQLRDNRCPIDDALRIYARLYFDNTREYTDRREYSLDEVRRAFTWAYEHAPRDPLPRFRSEVEVLPSPGVPYDVALELLSRWSRGGVPLIRRWRDSWMRWREMESWSEVTDEAVKAGLYQTLGASYYRKPSEDEGAEDELVPWNPNIRTVRAVQDALEGAAFLENAVSDPAWLDGRTDPAPGEVVACRNGLLHVTSRRLLPPDPRFFTQVALPLDYDVRAPEPKRWLEFLESLWPGDQQAVGALSEMFGYCVSGRTDLQKILLIVGPPRSGKGTIATVLSRLVGIENTAAPTLSSLGTQFGMQSLIGKSLAVIGDARVSGNTREIVSRLLGISGEDYVSVDRKNRSYWTGKLGVRFLILSNEVPGLRDASGALAKRFIPLILTRSWYGREDLGLVDDLLTELPGIMNWALDGLDRLRARGAFVVPESSAELVETLADTGSPISVFLRECCEFTGSIACNDLFNAWSLWAEQNGYRKGNAATFGRDLRSVLPHLNKIRPGPRGVTRAWQYENISLATNWNESFPQYRPPDL